MRRKLFWGSLCVLTIVTVCLLLLMQQFYPATLSQLLCGRAQASPNAVTVTSWPNNHENTFTIDDPALLEQLCALICDAPLVKSNQTAPRFPVNGCYRFALDDGRQVLTDGIYLYVGDRTYTAQTLPALLSLLYRADQKAQFYNATQSPLPPCENPVQRNADFYTEMAVFGLDAPGKFYVLGQQDDGRWLCYTSPKYISPEALLTDRGITLPQQLGDYQLTHIHSLSFCLDEAFWHNGGVMLLEGDFEAGRIYDWWDKLTIDGFSADYVGSAENPEHHKPTCPGLSVSFGSRQSENDLPAPPNGYTEEPPFDGDELCTELAGWQVQKVYSYAMGDQFEKGWLFTAPDSGLSAQFVTLYEVSDPTNIDWYHQAVHRDMTSAELTEEGQWLLPLLDVAAAMK